MEWPAWGAWSRTWPCRFGDLHHWFSVSRPEKATKKDLECPTVVPTRCHRTSRAIQPPHLAFVERDIHHLTRLVSTHSEIDRLLASIPEEVEGHSVRPVVERALRRSDRIDPAHGLYPFQLIPWRQALIQARWTLHGDAEQQTIETRLPGEDLWRAVHVSRGLLHCDPSRFLLLRPRYGSKSAPIWNRGSHHWRRQ